MRCLLLVLAVLVASSMAVPSPTQSAAPTTSPGIRLPILVDRDLPHPRNKNLQGEALLQWMARERTHVTNKYSKHRGKTRGKDHGKMQARQAAPLGSVNLGGFYFSQIGLGTPEQTYNVVLDTGSADFWVASTSCSGCDNMNLFNPSDSSTYQSSDQQFEVPYGQGGVRGSMGADNVSMAGYKISGLNFGIATQLASGTIQAPASGIMGMGFESLSSSGSTPFWQVVAIEGKLKDPVFSFELTDNTDYSSAGEVTAGGVFTLGNLDDQQYSGDITWIDLDSRYGSKGIGYWGIKMDALSVNGQNIDLGQDNLVAVDTGTTLIGAPESVVKAVYAQIPNAEPASSSTFGGQGYYVFPCSQKFEIAFTFGGKAFTLNQDDINIGQVDMGRETCGGALFVVDSPAGSATPGWILGDTFLSTVYSVYSWQPQRVGFASLPSNGPKTLALTETSGANTVASAATSNGGGGGISEPVSRSHMQLTGVVGGEGLPTPTLVEVPSGMQKLSAPSSLPTGGNSGIGGGVSQITVRNSAQWSSLTSELGGDGGGFFSIFGGGNGAQSRTGGVPVTLISLVAATLVACVAL